MALSSIAFMLVAAASAISQTTLPTHTEPMRNTFVVAAETVIDEASALDIQGDDKQFRAGMQQVAAAKANLSGMVEDDREQEIASATNDLIFAVQACHLQAKDGTDTTKCRAQVVTAQKRAMDALGRHKNGGIWVEGPPTR